VTDVNFLVYFNSGDDPVEVTLPDARHGARWSVAVDTAGELADRADIPAAAKLTVAAKSLLTLQEIDGEEAPHDDSVDASLRAQVSQAKVPAPAPRAEHRAL